MEQKKLIVPLWYCDKKSRDDGVYNEEATK